VSDQSHAGDQQRRAGKAEKVERVWRETEQAIVIEDERAEHLSRHE
jgi:hypothetical protein